MCFSDYEGDPCCGCLSQKHMKIHAESLDMGLHRLKIEDIL